MKRVKKFVQTSSELNAGFLKSYRTEKSKPLGRFKASEAGGIISAIRTLLMQVPIASEVVRRSSLQRFSKHALGVLREIFDENAYQRYLVRTGAQASVRTYREFQRERESAMATKPRCC